ncbi:hypothetical protein ACFP1C_10515 [Levilactobacillus fujinensis]|uniref:Uncharacterized protein n=1 Tax=Levilactobacillus fujinensis TaxID=2486024 RepID=A0ABW1TI74_9LACO
METTKESGISPDSFVVSKYELLKWAEKGNLVQSSPYRLAALMLAH